MREGPYAALSELFVDREVDYPAIARALDGYPLPVLERVLFEEVAPACHANLLAPVPPIWTGFDPQWLAEEVERRRVARSASLIRRLRHRLLAAWLRWRFRREWACLAAELHARDSDPRR